MSSVRRRLDADTNWLNACFRTAAWQTEPLPNEQNRCLMNRTAACFTLHATWILHSDTWYLLLTLKHQLLKRTAEILTVKPSLTTGWSQIKHGEKSNAFRTNRTTEDAISTAYLTSSQAGRESLGWQSLLLYVGAESSSLFTHVGTLRPPDSSDVKYADDNSIIISNINNDESLYWEEISHRAE